MRVYVRAELLALRARDADPAPEAMNARTQVLKQLVSESRYVVDPHAVADAIVARAMAGGRSGQLFAVPPSSRRSARVDGDTRRRRSG
ncbi:MAG: hypothetical protein QOD24_2157 [Solirubrobacteraceae bacterium]|jgi:hypothetical protein|nr:hypothetical protein [Solirubrobacteraceae bacterium]